MSRKQEFAALLEKGARLYASAQSAAAAEVYRRALEIAPEDPTARLRHALAIWHGENRGEEAETEIAALARKFPQASVHAAHALVLSSLGRFDDCAAAARRAVLSDPRHTGAWLSLASTAVAEDLPGLSDQLARVLEDRDLTAMQRRQAHFARATVLRRQGLEDAAFVETSLGNRLAPRKWDADVEARAIDTLRGIFTPEAVAQSRNKGANGQRMVFILGMPRSGTTLLERMLSAHPDVVSAGETLSVGNLWTQYRRQMGDTIPAPQHLAAMGKALLAGIKRRVADPTAARIIDKMPSNHLFVPLIRLMLPEATIVHMHRHPMDTCLSCYEASFSYGLDYASDLSDLGTAYRQYRDLMDHWTGAVGIDVVDVRYEDLACTPEPVIRRVLKAMDLDWSPDCLAPAEGGVIKTASVTQARGAVSVRSIGRWHKHEARLGPLIAALGGRAAIDNMADR